MGDCEVRQPLAFREEDPTARIRNEECLARRRASVAAEGRRRVRPAWATSIDFERGGPKRRLAAVRARAADCRLPCIPGRGPAFTSMADRAFAPRHDLSRSVCSFLPMRSALWFGQAGDVCRRDEPGVFRRSPEADRIASPFIITIGHGCASPCWRRRSRGRSMPRSRRLLARNEIACALATSVASSFMAVPGVGSHRNSITVLRTYDNSRVKQSPCWNAFRSLGAVSAEWPKIGRMRQSFGASARAARGKGRDQRQQCINVCRMCLHMPNRSESNRRGRSPGVAVQHAAKIQGSCRHLRCHATRTARPLLTPPSTRAASSSLGRRHGHADPAVASSRKRTSAAAFHDPQPRSARGGQRPSSR